MTTPLPVLCMKRGCKFFRGWKNLKPICMAFPQGIPTEILTGKNKHTETMPNDGGYKFTKK